MPRFATSACLTILVGVLSWWATPAKAQVILPGIEKSELEPSIAGRAWLEELNCVACHSSETLEDDSRTAPRLSQVGGSVHPDYLRSFLANPHEVKPGTLMPDLLHGTKEEDAEVTEAIVHFLVSLNQGKPFSPQAPDAVAAEAGEKLFHSVGCVACHSPRGPDDSEILPATSVPLGALEKKYSHESLTRFLQRPHSTRPSGRMPDLRLPGKEIEQIANFLLRHTKVPGHLAYTTWRGKVWEGLQGDVQKERAGHVEDFSLDRFEKLPHQTALRYEGYLKVDKPGDYTFFLEWNGGNLSLNGDEIVELEPSNRRGPQKKNGTATLTSGWNQIELTYFHTGREPRFSLAMEGPGFTRGEIPPSLLSISDRPIPTFQPLSPELALVKEGQAHFERLGCAQCHDDIPAVEPPALPALQDLDPTKGCLADQPSPGTPKFDLGEKQKALIRETLPTVENTELSDVQKINKTLAALNCISCHERKGLGGIEPERDAYFTGTREALGNQGRLPPPLTHVGAKLTKEWLSEVLLHGGRQREYLNTRMPVFGEANVGHLVDLLEKVDLPGLENATIPEVTSIRESKEAGYQMMGATGFSCIACHDFNGQRSGGAGALDLVHVTDRLNQNWFHLYMRQPNRFHPTVIMPSYWPGGESIRKEVLDGDPDKQIEALWKYLSDGRRAKPPQGLSRQSLQLRVANETLMCRGRGTAGYRGIGVGYPEEISLAFDTEEMALRLLWKGEFADINHGSFRARGRDRIEFPAGIPFHRLASLDDEWPYKGKTDFLFPKDHGYQYLGYDLDQSKRPTFRYRYGEILVRDFFEDFLDGEGRPFLRRTLTLAAPAEQELFYFRVASGKEIAENESRRWQIDRLTITLPEEASTELRDGEPKELLIPLQLPKGETILVLEYQW